MLSRWLYVYETPHTLLGVPSAYSTSVGYLFGSLWCKAFGDASCANGQGSLTLFLYLIIYMALVLGGKGLAGKQNMTHENCKDIFIGELIRQKVSERGMAYSEFAQRIHVARTSLYRIFESKTIDIDRLLLISDVLNFDFIHEIYLPGFSKNKTFVTGPCVVLPIIDGKVCVETLSEGLIGSPINKKIK